MQEWTLSCSQDPIITHYHKSHEYSTCFSTLFKITFNFMPPMHMRQVFQASRLKYLGCMTKMIYVLLISSIHPIAEPFSGSFCLIPLWQSHYLSTCSFPIPTKCFQYFLLSLISLITVIRTSELRSQNVIPCHLKSVPKSAQSQDGCCTSLGTSGLFPILSEDVCGRTPGRKTHLLAGR